MALCAFPGCDHPEGSVCTMAGCPGRKFKSQATPCGFGGDHFATVPAEPLNNARGDSAERFRFLLSHELTDSPEAQQDHV